MRANDDAKTLAAQSWFGYGRWEAPYWFIGMEPGGTDDHATYEAWRQLGGTELIDCREHHLASKNTKWHGRDRPPMQPTWGRLIQLVLGYEGKAADLDTVKVYQQRSWGSISGDTASLLLSALHAPNLQTKGVNRSFHREHRMAVLGERLKQYTPKFVIFYGIRYADYYGRIAEKSLTASGYVWRGSTLCVLVQHPRHARPSGWWAAKGQEIRAVMAKGVFRALANVPTISATDNNRPDVISVLVHENPKRGMSRLRFDCYRDGMTVAEYEEAVCQRLGLIEARKCRLDLKWDTDRRFIRIEYGDKLAE